MSYSALIRVAPIFTHARFNDPAWARPGRIMYEPGALRLLPSEETVPLLIDHDEERVIGQVDELFRLDWIDGPWIAARATVAGEGPWWLKRGAKASCEFRPLYRRDVAIRGTRADVIGNALLREVSILSPGVEPAEPLAELILLERSAPPTAEAGEVIYHPRVRESSGTTPTPSSEYAETAREQGFFKHRHAVSPPPLLFSPRKKRSQKMKLGRRRFTPEQRVCARCDRAYMARAENQRYCSSRCRYRARYRDEVALYANARHRGTRRAWAPVVAAGRVRCARGVACSRAELVDGVLVGGFILPGERWHLGHADGESVGGPEHVRCNTAAPSRLRAARATSRVWL